MEAHRQRGHRVRFDWGPTGAAAVAADVAVVVDVLSFTTTVTIAAERGIAVRPSPWRPAEDAGHRGRGLAPSAMAERAHVEELVVPSPNGSALAFGLAETGARVVAGCLRNRTAVAAWLDASATVAVVAAGERWPDGSLRPCAEDLWGAGAVLALLPEADLSPEARVAAAAFRAAPLPSGLHEVAGALELHAIGYGADVTLAAELDAASVVPELRGGVFRT
ncbi:2-phosphosulfolactate phosphatase [Nocardioides anomalus]|uniref:Probable 2-phosphosulfolactate phosphatase n=1 Tax=Nocardioides anomalus TaxID=2712223 RepID=A0A6G6WLT8_9ACTN|nr:2-phosphosulfolactate phosphatase [Nocardioides anomalus]